MEKIRLNEQELKKFYKKYTFTELMNFKGLFEFVFDYDLEEALKLLEEEADRKQYQRDSFSKNYKVKRLNNKELDFLYDMAEDADLCLSNTDCIDVEAERKATTRLLGLIEEEKNLRSMIVPKPKLKKYGMNLDELEILFRKFDVYDLEQINKILDPIAGYDIEPVQKALKNVNEEKWSDYAANFSVPIAQKRYSILSVTDESNLKNLTIRELEFMKKLISTHFDGMLCSDDCFSALESYLELLECAMGSIYDELQSRKPKAKKAKKKEA